MGSSGWADSYIREVELGRTIKFRPTGNSMEPHIKSGQLVQVTPMRHFLDSGHPKVGDIVLCLVNGSQYLHLITKVEKSPLTSSIRRERYEIGNAHGKINGWATKIYGLVTNVED